MVGRIEALTKALTSLKKQVGRVKTDAEIEEERDGFAGVSAKKGKTKDVLIGEEKAKVYDSITGRDSGEALWRSKSVKDIGYQEFLAEREADDGENDDDDDAEQPGGGGFGRLRNKVPAAAAGGPRRSTRRASVTAFTVNLSALAASPSPSGASFSMGRSLTCGGDGDEVADGSEVGYGSAGGAANSRCYSPGGEGGAAGSRAASGVRPQLSPLGPGSYGRARTSLDMPTPLPPVASQCGSRPSTPGGTASSGNGTPTGGAVASPSAGGGGAMSVFMHKRISAGAAGSASGDASPAAGLRLPSLRPMSGTLSLISATGAAAARTVAAVAAASGAGVAGPASGPAAYIRNLGAGASHTGCGGGGSGSYLRVSFGDGDGLSSPMSPGDTPAHGGTAMRSGGANTGVGGRCVTANAAVAGGGLAPLRTRAGSCVGVPSVAVVSPSGGVGGGGVKVFAPPSAEVKCVSPRAMTNGAVSKEPHPPPGAAAAGVSRRASLVMLAAANASAAGIGAAASVGSGAVGGGRSRRVSFAGAASTSGHSHAHVSGAASASSGHAYLVHGGGGAFLRQGLDESAEQSEAINLELMEDSGRWFDAGDLSYCDAEAEEISNMLEGMLTRPLGAAPAADSSGSFCRSSTHLSAAQRLITPAPAGLSLSRRGSSGTFGPNIGANRASGGGGTTSGSAAGGGGDGSNSISGQRTAAGSASLLPRLLGPANSVGGGGGAPAAAAAATATEAPAPPPCGASSSSSAIRAAMRAHSTRSSTHGAPPQPEAEDGSGGTEAAAAQRHAAAAAAAAGAAAASQRRSSTQLLIQQAAGRRASSGFAAVVR